MGCGCKQARLKAAADAKAAEDAQKAQAEAQQQAAKPSS